MLIEMLEALIARLDHYYTDAKRSQDAGTHLPNAYWGGVMYTISWAEEELRDILEKHSHPDRLALAHLKRLLARWEEGSANCAYTAGLYQDSSNLHQFWKGKAHGHDYASAELAELIAYMKQRRKTP